MRDTTVKKTKPPKLPVAPVLPKVAIFVFDGMSMFHMAAPTAVLSDASGLFEVVYFSETVGSVTLSAGLTVQVAHDLGVLASADMIVIPSWPASFVTPSAALAEALLTAHARNIPLVGLCLGAFVLAALGVLDGRKATTHWAYADDFTATFPQVTWDASVLYVDHGDVITSAGTAAAIDCCLQIVRNREGSKTANKVARTLVMPPQRMGGQAQYIASPIPKNRRDTDLSKLLDEVSTNLHQAHSIDSLAEKLAMSRRTFTRHFQQNMGRPFGEWLLQQRLLFAQQLLEEGSTSVDKVAEQAGFGSVVTFRAQFKKLVGVTPNSWRKTFQSGAS